MLCDVIIWKLEIENWMKLAGYPVYFENELIDYGQFPSVALRVEKNDGRVSEATRNGDSELGVRFPSRGANSGLTGVSSFGFGGSDQMWPFFDPWNV